MKPALSPQKNQHETRLEVWHMLAYLLGMSAEFTYKSFRHKAKTDKIIAVIKVVYSSYR
ncbi:hypothetical protein [Lacticaseibacillus zeae]|uniref:Uncharacterized protein n=1 Tax=Lacticaseibacillus zeae DSM 20178 = KCTC 3804 TaxID=1423816 RepID=A0A0R1ETG5_LACZE|nr:hypothetical protein [Lacticaseibacillus zeae]KRK12589.1 hypothetical protein FD51_GL002722 [Lacticaseibacillus zeae DSM 20178 = KCTC 3804]